LLHAVEAAMAAVKKSPRPETYRALLEAANGFLLASVAYQAD